MAGMHDWSLISIQVDWAVGSVQIDLRSPTGHAAIAVSGFQNLLIPKDQLWGASRSINKVVGPTQRNDGLFDLAIEMQSGDVIEIQAASFDLPNAENK